MTERFRSSESISLRPSETAKRTAKDVVHGFMNAKKGIEWFSDLVETTATKTVEKARASSKRAKARLERFAGEIISDTKQAANNVTAVAAHAKRKTKKFAGEVASDVISGAKTIKQNTEEGMEALADVRLWDIAKEASATLFFGAVVASELPEAMEEYKANERKKQEQSTKELGFWKRMMRMR